VGRKLCLSCYTVSILGKQQTTVQNVEIFAYKSQNACKQQVIAGLRFCSQLLVDQIAIQSNVFTCENWGSLTLRLDLLPTVSFYLREQNVLALHSLTAVLQQHRCHGSCSQ
jgi:hypothetical protein